MSAKGSSTGEYLNELSKLPIGDIRYRIYKNYPKAGMLTYIEDMYVAGWYQYEETQEKPVWIINSEKKEILGYACQKATTLFRGRTWIAWYTTAIPVNDGPWKLWGLPGLILEANDSKDIYHFTALGIKKMDANQLIQLPKKRYIKCTRKELSQLKLEYSRDPLGFMERLSGAKVVEVGKGTPERKSLNYEPMETDLK
jgi:GLPGLI family protein